MLKEDNKEARRRQAALASDMQAVVKKNIATILKTVTPQQVADHLDVTEQAVSGWKRTGKIAPHYFARVAALAGWTVDEFLSPLGKSSGVSTQEPRATYSPLEPITMADALAALAETLIHLDEDGRDAASTVLSRLARNPSSDRLRAAVEMLETIVRLHSRLDDDPDPPSGPEPSSPRFSRKVGIASERRTDGKVQLTVKPGGGKKVQMGLPFKTTVSDPWDEEQAPANERAWYGRLREKPKAETEARSRKVKAK